MGPYAGHLHLVDAEGFDGEGLQIGDGEINFSKLAEQLEKLAPKAGFIPEIWQGHLNHGEGFRNALQTIEDLIRKKIRGQSFHIGKKEGLHA